MNITCEIFNQPEEKNSLIIYGFASTEFGPCLIGLIDKKICHLSFYDHVLSPEQGAFIIKQEWGNAQFVYDVSEIEKIAQKIFSCGQSKMYELTLVLKGTPFQIAVWKAVMAIPRGQTLCYEGVAHAVGRPRAVRAAASSLARNNISYLIPCHRVLTKDSKVHNYRWGAARKKAMLEQEGVIIKKQKNESWRQ